MKKNYCPKFQPGNPISIHFCPFLVLSAPPEAKNPITFQPRFRRGCILERVGPLRPKRRPAQYGCEGSFGAARLLRLPRSARQAATASRNATPRTTPSATERVRESEAAADGGWCCCSRGWGVGMAVRRGEGWNPRPTEESCIKKKCKFAFTVCFRG